METAGAAMVFTPGTTIQDIVSFIRDNVRSVLDQ
jgi:methylmalonyl-CoA mutase cobalamin-binding subunit